MLAALFSIGLNATTAFMVVVSSPCSSFLGVPLNSTTSLSFGLVLVVSVATVIHIVSHYYEVSQHEHDRVQAVRKALAIVVRPCLMCSLTTAVAFATIMISTIPMVQQLGLVMSLGVLMPPSGRAVDQ